MTRAEYAALYPPPLDPRARRAYEVAFEAMELGYRPWGPPPVTGTVRKTYEDWKGRSDSEIKAGRLSPRMCKDWLKSRSRAVGRSED